MKIAKLFLAAALLLTPRLLLADAPTTQPASTGFAALAPHPIGATLYDEKADTKLQIAAALTRAKKENRRVLIQWGGNWCGWCIALHDLCVKDPNLAHILLYEYDVVHADAGINGKNVDFAKSYGADLASHGYPYLTILDADGKPLANQETGTLEVKNADGGSVGVQAGHDKTKVLAFLQKYVAPPLKADDLFAAALAEAKASHREVFLHFGAPWCGWCHKLENWMARPAVADILGKDFVELKIDIDRTTGGAEMAKKFGATGGIPWFAFLDANSQVITTSAAAGSNIGFPSQPEEITQFAAMLKKSARHMTESDIQTLIDSLKADAK